MGVADPDASLAFPLSFTGQRQEKEGGYDNCENDPVFDSCLHVVMSLCAERVVWPPNSVNMRTAVPGLVPGCNGQQRLSSWGYESQLTNFDQGLSTAG